MQAVRSRERFANAANSWQAFPRPVRKLLAASVGFVVFAVGIALLVLPGPGIAVIVLGLAILATEFTWAQRSMHHVKRHGHRAKRAALAARGSIASRKRRKNDA